MVSVLEVDRLSRSYVLRGRLAWRPRREVQAVRDVSFRVEPGETFGLAGPNSAGRTTIVKMLATFLLPTAGRARVLGYDGARQFSQVRPRVGYVFGGARGLYDRLSALVNLRYFAVLRLLATGAKDHTVARKLGMSIRTCRRYVAELMRVLGTSSRFQAGVEAARRGLI